MRRLLGTLCALILLSGTGQAGTIWTGTNYRIDASPSTPVGTSLHAVTLTLVGLNGAKPNAFDGETGALTGITTSGSSLHQVFEFTPMGSPTPTLALLVAANSIYYPIDTHFLVDPSIPDIASTIAPNEDQLVADATEAPNAGYGSVLSGQFALLGAPPSTWDFAYLVTQAGTVVNLDFHVADGSGTHPFEHVQASVVVPEPATILLVAFGALAVGIAHVARRRYQGSRRGGASG